MPAHVGRRAIDASLTASLVFVSIGSGLFLPLSLVFFVELTDIRLSMLGVLVGLAGFTSVPVPAVAGRLADRYGARRLVLVAQGIQALAYLGYAFARDPLSVFAVTAIMSIGGRLFWSTIFAALADHAQDGPRQQHWFALANIAHRGSCGRRDHHRHCADGSGHGGLYRARTPRRRLPDGIRLAHAACRTVTRARTDFRRIARAGDGAA
ncbi:hypothetical protein GCM10029963_00090 [Micromonospora andamanensis]